MYKFIDRKSELDFLNKEYEKSESSLVILYGRRRIGKTSLMKEFAKNKDVIYYLATEESEKQNIEYFKLLVAREFRKRFIKIFKSRKLGITISNNSKWKIRFKKSNNYRWISIFRKDKYSISINISKNMGWNIKKRKCNGNTMWFFNKYDGSTNSKL